MLERRGKTTLHDWGYQQLLSDPANFVQLLQNFTLDLKDDHLKAITPDMLQLVEKTYTFEEFQDQEADVIYRLTWRDEEVFLYLIIKTESLDSWEFKQRIFWYAYRVIHEVVEPPGGKVNWKRLYKFPQVFVIKFMNADVAKLWREPDETNEYEGSYHKSP